MDNCVTGKRCYDTQEQAEEALIDHHIRFNHSHGSGPVNVYQCHDCGMYHFTSKGNLSQVIVDNQEYIKSQQRAKSWEDKFRY